MTETPAVEEQAPKNEPVQTPEAPDGSDAVETDEDDSPAVADAKAAVRK